MTHKRCNKADGTRYVQKRLESNPELLRTISHDDSICNYKKGHINRQIESIHNILKSQKHKR